MRACVRARVGVCVCACEPSEQMLNIVKPLFLCLGFICRGRQGRCMAVANEAPCSRLGYHGWSPWRTCYQFLTISDMGRGSAQEPPRRFWSIISCTAFAIWFYSNWKLQQPSVRMSTENFLQVSHPFLSRELDWFAPKIHSTSQFAMTVLRKCVTHVGSTRWHEPFGEYLAR